MSRIEPDFTAEVSVNPFAERTAEAMASLQAEARKREAQGYAMIGGAMNYGEAAHGTGVFGKVSHGAKLFCIAFAFLAPNLLFIKYVL